MKLLLDTHAFLWFVTNDPLLSETDRDLITDPLNEVLLSPATYWEVAIKVSIGKHPLAVPFDRFFTTGIIGDDILVLPIEVRHAAALASMPLHHNDFFDRLIVAQAIVEQVPIVSIDVAPDAAGITRLW